MNRHHLRSLLRVEFRRNRRNVLIGLGIAAAAVPALNVVGRADPASLALALFAATFIGAVGVLANTLRDKLTGQLEFLTTLPVRSSTLVCAVFLATALALLPVVAAVGGVVYWTALPKLGVDGGFWWTLGASAAGWLLVSALACLSCGMVLRIDVNKIGYLAVACVVLPLLGGDQIERWVRTSGPAVLEFASANPDLAWALGAAAFLLLFGTMLGVGFFVARQGYERYRPKLDLLEW